MDSTNSTLFSRVKFYRKLSEELQLHLAKYPNDWPKFQEIFNLTLDKISLDIMQFERDNLNKFEADVYKLKKIFEKRYRRYFLYGEYPKWSYEKPFGYPGDFKIIDDIYKNQPSTVGFDGLWDHYFQQMIAARATRQRKEDFKKIIIDFVKKHRDIRIMNLASGPAREIKELLEVDSDKIFSNVIFDCYDFDIRAINYAKQLLNNPNNVNFFQKNAIRMALKRNIEDEIQYRYDLIYSTGFFDYLDEGVAIRLANNLKKLLKPDGIMVVANFGDKYNNLSAGLMEWATDWYLVYRTEDEFRKIFLDAGFSHKNLKLVSQDSNKVMLYCFVEF
ncbi:MAG: class I SAM-dependent methyltransferase family protein [Candidatus Omnitrophica bacterium]|nr:class I SAM-dependent methyltransferase family protein [Candidatus Omnitrophota bacterium]